MLYHYTSPEVIMRIIREEGICLRFSRYDCLNDTHEGREAVEIQQEICDELRTEYADNHNKLTLLDEIAALRPDFKSITVEDDWSDGLHHAESDSRLNRKYSSAAGGNSTPENDSTSDNDSTHGDDLDLGHRMATIRTVSAVPYICSFSRERDALNMWNYYTTGARYEGYNVGINVENLRLQVCEPGIDENIVVSVDCMECDIITRKAYRSGPELKCEWWRVIYDKSQQRDKIRYEIERILKEGNFVKEEYIAQLNNWAIRFKNEIFRHEREERLICYVPEEEMDNGATLDDYIQFRIVKGCLVPYLDVLVADKSALKEITIGPLIEEKLAVNTMELFLRLKGYENVDIYTSSAPIRY